MNGLMGAYIFAVTTLLGFLLLMSPWLYNTWKKKHSH